MALTGAERSVQERGLRATRADGVLDDAERAVEGAGEARRDDVVPDGRLDVVDALVQVEDEVAGMDLLGDLDDVAQQGHLQGQLLGRGVRRTAPPAGAGAD